MSLGYKCKRCGRPSKREICTICIESLKSREKPPRLLPAEEIRMEKRAKEGVCPQCGRTGRIRFRKTTQDYRCDYCRETFPEPQAVMRTAEEDCPTCGVARSYDALTGNFRCSNCRKGCEPASREWLVQRLKDLLYTENLRKLQQQSSIKAIRDEPSGVPTAQETLTAFEGKPSGRHTGRHTGKHIDEDTVKKSLWNIAQGLQGEGRQGEGRDEEGEE